MLSKTNIKGFLKDPDTGAVINNNFAELDMILIQRSEYIENKQLKNKVDQLQNEIELIKQLIVSGNKINV